MLKYLLIAVVVIWLLYSPFLRRARQLKRQQRPAAPSATPGPAKPPQVEGQQQSQQGQGLQTPDRLRLALAPRPPGQRASGQQQAHQG